MVQIIAARPKQGPSKGQQFDQFLNMANQAYQAHSQKKLAEQRDLQEIEAGKRMGLDLTGLPPEARRKAFEMSFQDMQNQKKSQTGFENEMKLLREKHKHEREMFGDKLRAGQDDASLKLKQKNEEALVPLTHSLDRVNRMRQLRGKGNLGMGSSWTGLINPETRKDFGEYSTLGKSLISMVSTIPVRNQREFEIFSHQLIDPTITDAEAEGVLDGLERIIRDSMNEYQTPQQGISGGQGSTQNRPPLSSFRR